MKPRNTGAARTLPPSLHSSNGTPIPEGAATLREAIAEAELIISRHDGMHVLHSDHQALRFMNAVREAGGAVDTMEVQRILERMRQADYTGVYPSHCRSAESSGSRRVE